jgi:hypothetical protein
MSYSARSAIMNAGMTYLSKLQSETPSTREAATIAFLKKQAGVAAVGSANAGSIWARFTDNTYWVLDETFGPDQSAKSVDRLAAPEMRSSAAQTGGSRTRATRAAAGGMDLPTSTAALLLDTVPNLGTPTATLSAMLSKKGYKPTTPDPSVDNLKNVVTDVAVLHWSTHGGKVDDPTTGDSFWGAMTTTPDNAQTEAQYKADLANTYGTNKVGPRLIFFSAPYIDNNQNLVTLTNLAVTGFFITYYNWSFAPNSLAFLNCCWSYESGVAGSLLVLKKPAGVVLGWSNAVNPTKAWASAKFMFDRVLGSNMDGESPPQRPFDVASVFTDAKNSGKTDGTVPGTIPFTTGPYGTCTLQYSPMSGGVLAPSIEYVTVQERSHDPDVMGQLTLTGEFGSVQGTVTVGGSDVTVIDWSPTTIHCQLPAANAAGGSGDVKVTSTEQISSNTIPLTLWQGTATYKAYSIPPPAAYQIPWNVTGTIYFRADVHSYRTASGADLVNQPDIYFRAAAPSNASYTAMWLPGAPAGVSGITPGSGTILYGLRTSAAAGDMGFEFEGDIVPGSSPSPSPGSVKINIGYVVLGLLQNQYLEAGHPVTITMPVESTFYQTTFGASLPTGFLIQHPIAQSFSDGWTFPGWTKTGQFLETSMPDTNTLQWTPTGKPADPPVAANGEDNSSPPAS